MWPVSIGSSARMAAACGILSAATATMPAPARADAARADVTGADAAADRAAVAGALGDSAAGWSRNDLAGFMAVYEDAPSTTYLSGHAVVRGFAAIRAMYAARFGGSPGGPAPGGMGRLTLDVIDIRPLGPDYALCIGRFRLVRPSPASPPATGMFTLVFHRTPDGWKIASDHTSA